MTQIDRPDSDLENPGNFLRRKLFKMEEDKDMSIANWQQVESLPDPQLLLFTLQEPIGAHFGSEQPGDEHVSRFIRQGRGQRSFSPHAAFFGQNMLAAKLNQSLPRHLTKPGVKGKWRIIQIFRQTL